MQWGLAHAKPGTFDPCICKSTLCRDENNEVAYDVGPLIGSVKHTVFTVWLGLAFNGSRCRGENFASEKILCNSLHSVLVSIKTVKMLLWLIVRVLLGHNLVWLFLHANFICKKQRNNRCLLRDSVTEFVFIGSQVLRWTVVSKTSVSQSHLTRQGDQIPSTTVAQGLKYLLVRESKIARKGGLCSDLKAKHWWIKMYTQSGQHSGRPRG